ncbi:hypothetical protein SY2F82_14300 [Streptomyces sp. Y2F8-2]|nr:hypothetical protein SY2F82_14300 [Streptomyces sp. Y2F8-2]
MIVIAVSVLPTLGLLLLVMDRVEDWLSGPSSIPGHARRRRHLRLIPGGAQESGSPSRAVSNERRPEAA